MPASGSRTGFLSCPRTPARNVEASFFEEACHRRRQASRLRLDSKAPCPEPHLPPFSADGAPARGLLVRRVREVQGHPLIGPGRNQLHPLRGVPDDDVSLDHDALAEDHVAFHDELIAVDERRRAVHDQPLHGVRELVHPVELDVGRDALAALAEDHPVVARQLVRVRAQCKEIVGCLHGRESGPRDDKRNGSWEALDRCAHGSLQLDDFGGVLVPRINGFAVFHDGQGQRPFVLVKLVLEGLQVHPEVVGVEEGILGRVLEGLLIRIWALRRLAEQQVAAGLLPCQMPTLLVGICAVCHLHHEGCPLLCEVSEDLQVHGRPQVVGV
mmetsp:Transcript_6820/g.16183  ORF Transcript_6820/g.16183 Transcript_6820/m.16183 type:complete len:327 (-) Transcript_6820:692-1672(-)